MSLLDPRQAFKPYDYSEAYTFWELQQTSFWLHTEISMDSDIYDWKFNLTESERNIIGNILKSFVQSEVLIGDYWRKIADTFPKPEIALMASAFSGMEGIHQVAYAYLQDSLGLNDFESFLQDETVIERLQQISKFPEYVTTQHGHYLELKAADEQYRKDLARSIAVFSSFGEGVLLFSAFTILMSFAQRGLMRGLGEIIELSIRDESLHARAGCWLFRTFMSENQDIKGIKKEIYEACNLALEIEDKFIDSVFVTASLPNCEPEDLKQFIRSRANKQLKEIGLKPQFKIDRQAIKRLNWFDIASSGDQHGDFFSSRITQYARTSGWGGMFEGVTE